MKAKFKNEYDVVFNPDCKGDNGAVAVNTKVNNLAVQPSQRKGVLLIQNVLW
jgi:hypothetical protein